MNNLHNFVKITYFVRKSVVNEENFFALYTVTLFNTLDGFFEKYFTEFEFLHQDDSFHL